MGNVPARFIGTDVRATCRTHPVGDSEQKQTVVLAPEPGDAQRVLAGLSPIPVRVTSDGRSAHDQWPVRGAIHDDVGKHSTIDIVTNRRQGPWTREVRRRPGPTVLGDAQHNDGIASRLLRRIGRW